MRPKEPLPQPPSKLLSQAWCRSMKHATLTPLGEAMLKELMEKRKSKEAKHHGTDR